MLDTNAIAQLEKLLAAAKAGRLASFGAVSIGADGGVGFVMAGGRFSDLNLGLDVLKQQCLQKATGSDKPKSSLVMARPAGLPGLPS